MWGVPGQSQRIAAKCSKWAKISVSHVLHSTAMSHLLVHYHQTDKEEHSEIQGGCIMHD